MSCEFMFRAVLPLVISELPASIWTSLLVELITFYTEPLNVVTLSSIYSLDAISELTVGVGILITFWELRLRGPVGASILSRVVV
jgi:hypothetical protein